MFRADDILTFTHPPTWPEAVVILAVITAVCFMFWCVFGQGN